MGAGTHTVIRNGVLGDMQKKALSKFQNEFKTPEAPSAAWFFGCGPEEPRKKHSGARYES